jgi:hypothetical protein
MMYKKDKLIHASLNKRMWHPTTSIVVAQVIGHRIYAIAKTHDSISKNKWVNKS